MEIQLEFNFDGKTEEQMTLHLMQKQIGQIHVTSEKVRKRLFAEIGEVKKSVIVLQQENEELKAKLKELGHGKTEWIYGQNGCLFDVRKYQEIAN